ncbi:hypothetical protein H2199_002040 [Coniosporium tulheliwenetii]|uniref:Uncharacterized protein n=1 Tax=Coniosporium tulheliwenetii TaxID=3383036 RepID=A0ACC2ZHM2_9PEZI|nr:hypothetical protein H2199_002040 [Cladosporium sp. JES 115]
MFRNRTNSQKPNEEFLASFKATFPQLVQTARSADALQSSASLTDALDVAIPTRAPGHMEELKDGEPTPRPSNEQWRLTPSLLDPNSFAFSNFAAQPPGYYTPTPGGTNTLYHSQAGDLHTPGFSFGLGTPLSLPTSEGALHAGQTSSASVPAFNPHAIAQHHFQNQNPFALHQHQSFAPHQFSHQPTTFEPMIQSHNDGTTDSKFADVEMHGHSPILTFPSQAYEDTLRPLRTQQVEHFRYHVTLNAPTAMIKQSDEIPVTYLNKGQAYSVSIVDTNPSLVSNVPVKYRTFVRISFEDEQQRQRPGACWQLWKEGRGTNEAHQRGGRLQAVEFVDPTQAGGDMSGRPHIELESASFDGFCVTWSPPPNAPSECSVAVRFNFLSTDFSHSKGVKGIPVRLCAKTHLLTDEATCPPEAGIPETCYCKVKLFRDHGAERKLSNDVAHVKKTIDKLKQQISQAESGLKEFGKRKRSGSVARMSASSRPGKVPKHKRTWSMDSSSSTGNRVPPEEDLHSKLATLQDMFTSTRPASVLYLRGEELDDPDLHPVHLSGEPQDLTKVEPIQDTSMWERQSVHTTGTGSIVSPTPSSQSLHSSGHGRRSSTFQHTTAFNPPSRVSSGEWRNMPQTATGDLQPAATQQMSPPNLPIKLRKAQSDEHGTLSGWIEAVGVDYSYQPPPERVIKPVACLYVQPRIAGSIPEDHYYRAVYLIQRTVKDLVNGIAMKSKIEPTKVVRTIRITPKGLHVLVDEDAVQEIPEGQDIIAEFYALKPHSPIRREWDSGPTDVQVDGDLGAIENIPSAGYELRLIY